MTPDAAILTLSQWFSPSYPLGSFAYSHGLETAIQQGTLDSAAGVEAWLRDLLQHGTGYTDAILLRAAYGCDDLEAASRIDAAARAYAPSAERLLESVEQGAAFSRTTQAIWGLELAPLTHPVAVGYAAARLDLPADLTVRFYLQAFLSNLVSGAVRLVPLGQTEGQRVLKALTDICHDVTHATRSQTLDDMMSACFAADIAAMQHETLEHRIFRT